MVSPLRPAVVAGFPGFTVQFEGRVHTMYADVRGLITTGVGNLIDPIQAALSLPWRHADGGLASVDQIRADWNSLKSRGVSVAHHNPDVQASIAGLTLHLDDAAIDALVRSRLESNAADLQRRHFPKFADYPSDAQMAILSLAWAAGSDWPTHFPACKAAILAGHWDVAAKEGQLRATAPDGTPNPGVIPRNSAQIICFANAEVTELYNLDPEPLYYPSFVNAAAAAQAEAARA